MKLWTSLLLIFFSISVYAKTSRYIIPDDKDVLIRDNTHISEDVLYPYDFEVLVWNIYKGEKSKFNQEFNNLAKDKDLLLLQEGFGNKAYKKMVNNFPNLEFIMATAWIDGKRSMTPTGVVTASLAKSKSTVWQRSYYREPFLGTPKMALATKYKLAGLDESILVINIHAINFVKTYKFNHMLEQTKSIINKHVGPILFGGDFNTHLNARYTFMQKMFKELGFSEVKFNPDKRFKILGRYLDFVFVRDLQIFGAYAPSSPGSDHNPMILRLGLF